MNISRRNIFKSMMICLTMFFIVFIFSNLCMAHYGMYGSSLYGMYGSMYGMYGGNTALQILQALLSPTTTTVEPVATPVAATPVGTATAVAAGLLLPIF